MCFAFTSRSPKLLTRRAVILLLLTFGIASANAEALNDLVSRLRSEPMSMFDWGMYQLERELQQVRRDDRDFLRVYYSRDSERLVVDASFVVLQDEIKAITAKTACYSRLHAIKLLFGVIDTSEIHLAPASDYRLGLKFSHQDPETQASASDPEKIGRDLMSAIEIEVAISSEKMEFPFSPDLRCSGKLLKQAVRYDGIDDIGSRAEP